MLKNALAQGEELTDGQGAGRAGRRGGSGKAEPLCLYPKPLLSSLLCRGPWRSPVSAQPYLHPGSRTPCPCGKPIVPKAGTGTESSARGGFEEQHPQKGFKAALLIARLPH